MTLRKIQNELKRLRATDASATLDARFEPDAGELVKFELQDTYWHLLPEHFIELLKDLPDGAGSEAIRTAIAQKAVFVWHGPEPKGSRDSSP